MLSRIFALVSTNKDEQDGKRKRESTEETAGSKATKRKCGNGTKIHNADELSDDDDLPAGDPPNPHGFICLKTKVYYVELNEKTNAVIKRKRGMTFVLHTHVLQRIPKYRAELEKKSGTISYVGQPMEITDKGPYDLAAFSQALCYVGGSPLPAIDPGAANVLELLKMLLRMVAVSAALGLPKLSDDVLAHIEGSPSLSAGQLLDFAKIVYAGDKDGDLAVHAPDSPVGNVLQRMLTTLFSAKLDKSTMERMNAEKGVLKTVLFEVLMCCHGRKQAIKKE
ncbi:hypothetical protein WHR41_00094 [Cladosporium halotolerans]|uniref:BTB domain-containing protein n=1 Tax=Cladosporium halotolerans TaxID=1052096 RepID=A0AB34L518_9PEZI